MNFQTAVFDDDTINQYPVIVLDEKLCVFHFNEHSGKIFPGLVNGENIANIVYIPDLITITQKHLPAPAAVIPGKTSYLASLCPIRTSSEMFYIITVIPDSASEEAKLYITAKTTILRECITSAKRITYRPESNKTDEYANKRLSELCKSLSTYTMLTEAMNRESINTNSVELDKLLTVIFKYYQKVRFNDERVHFILHGAEGFVKMTPMIVTVLTGAYHFVMRASRNSYVEVTVEKNENKIGFFLRCLPARKYGEKIGSLDDESLYRFYGFEASDLIYIRKLAENNGWDYSLSYENEHCICLYLAYRPDFKNIKVCNQPFPGTEYDTVYNIVDMFLDREQINEDGNKRSAKK